MYETKVGTARLKNPSITIYWTPFFLLSIVIIKQSVHIKYTKSTQRQKRLIFSKKFPIKFFLVYFFFIFPLLLFYAHFTTRSHLFGTRLRSSGALFKKRDIHTRARARLRSRASITIYYYYFIFLLFFSSSSLFMSLKKAPNRGLHRYILLDPTEVR